MTMKNNNLIKTIIFSLMVVLIFTINISPIQASINADPIKWSLCSFGDTGKEVLKATRTDYIPYSLYSKSVIGSEDSRKDNFYNNLLSVSGFEFTNDKDKKITPFDRFGMAG